MLGMLRCSPRFRIKVRWLKLSIGTLCCSRGDELPMQLSFLQRTTDSLDGNSLIRCEEAHEPRKGSPAYAQAHKITSSPLPLLLSLKCGAILSSYSLLTLPHVRQVKEVRLARGKIDLNLQTDRRSQSESPRGD